MLIKFDYMHRDGGNYKNRDWVIIEIADGHTLSEIDTIIRSHMVDGVYFYPHQWGLPELFPDPLLHDDPDWHEFISVGEVECDGSPLIKAIPLLPAAGLSLMKT